MTTIMKRIIISALLTFAVMTVAAGNLSITVVQPEYDNLPEEARLALEAKLEQILTANNVIAGQSDRFAITAKFVVNQKDITPTTPARISEKLQVTILIGDAIDSKVFARTNMQVAGIGVTETKALIQAFQRIPTGSPAIKQLVEDASAQITDYYTNHCDLILQDAERLAKMQQYDEAIAKLSSVPDFCESCYTKCQDKAVALYQQKLDIDCTNYIREAETIWGLKHNYAQAQKAMDILLQVDPHAACVQDADSLIKAISATLRSQEAAAAAHQREIEQRNWEMKVQQYNDNLELRKQRMQILGNIGTELSKNLPTMIKAVKGW